MEALLQTYPVKRIKPANGMAVTAQVWDEAHNYHRQSLGLHALFSHGSGIIAGLEVIASDPPDTSVYILPGIAIDPAGQVIVLPQPVSYDIGYELDGALYLLLNYGESQGRVEDNVEEGAPAYLHTEFSISAGTVLPTTPWVELARVNRSARDAMFVNAKDPLNPGPDEIDLRYRREVNGSRDVSVAVCYLGKVKDNKAGRGLNYLAQTLNYQGRYHLIIEDGATIGPGIVSNTLVYLVGQGKFELNSGIMNGLRNYVQRAKGTLLLEGLDADADAVFTDFLNTVNMQPAAVESGNPLLARPYMFAAPPTGFETQGNPKLLVGDGVIFSTFKYGLVWQGERNGRLATRDEIRTATEWGTNIIAYAEERRRMSGQQ